MCYSQEASINAFIIGLVCIVIMLIRRAKYDYWHILFIASYVFVQLGEAFVWTSVAKTSVAKPSIAKPSDLESEKKKEIGTKIILTSVLFQPITQLFGAYLVNQNPLYLVASLAGLSAFKFIDMSTKVTVGPTGHLSWPVPFTNQTYASIYYAYYLGGMLLPLFSIDNLLLRNSLLTYGLGSILYSYYNYNKTKEFTSYWCYLATGYSVLYLMASTQAQ